MGIDPTDPYGLKYAPVIPDDAPTLRVNPEPPQGENPFQSDLEVLFSPPVPAVPAPAPDTSPEVRGSEPCTFEEFMKVDLRVGTIRSAERVPKSDKLLKLQVSFGSMGDRQILAGIGKTFEPSELVGHKSVFVVNLPPRKMMGLESHGMILATGAPEALTLLTIPSSAAVEGYRFG